ncbi:MAG: alpha/beta fold hydrolase [Legionellaceae bacterium]|nr:alpha/beta fold hydrolase [Legionellaceae bacterium]
MKTEDFQYMWRGKVIRDLPLEEANLLEPVDIKRCDSGRAMLLLHGFSSSPAIYREFISAFTMYDAILCPVLPGHADSIDAFADAKATDWVNVALQSYAELAKNYSKVDVMGLSLGGLLAGLVANKYSPNHLYLLAPALNLHGFTNARLRLAQSLKFLGIKQIPNWAGNFHVDKYQELTYKKLPINAVIEILSLVKNNQFVLPTCKTDLFLGHYDEVVDSDMVEKRFASCSNTTVHWLNNSAHVLPLDGDMQAIIDCVKENNS